MQAPLEMQCSESSLAPLEMQCSESAVFAWEQLWNSCIGLWVHLNSLGELLLVLESESCLDGRWSQEATSGPWTASEKEPW